MSNSSWVEAYPSGRSEYLRFEGSDHRPIVTSFDHVKAKQKGLFRYDRRLRDNEEVKRIVTHSWNLNQLDSVEKRLSRCRSAIIEWNKEQHSNSQKKIEALQMKLEEAMTSQDLKADQLEVINKELSLAYQVEEEIWRQRSRQLWLALGERNSGFFHAATRGRKAVNSCSVMETEDDKLCHDSLSIVEEALQPCIPPEVNEQLISIPTSAEIKKACFSIHADKAPGPDGFSASFFQSNWDSIGEKVIGEVQSFFSSDILPAHINHTHVRLIPKITSPRKVADFRPIALCSVYYKIISKILSKRLQPVLQNIISDNQSAFVTQRAISDNVLITHETLHYLKTSGAKKKCFMTVKSDMSKAYHRLEWGFIKDVLERMGFHEKWVMWIMQCVSTVSYSYLLNGSAKGFVKPERGIRQGDPLSPYIFILCSEVLSGLCKSAQEKRKLVGIRVAKGSPGVNHLLFADDTMFFCRSDPQSCKALMEILHKYEQASGQKINEQKSAITFSSKTHQDTKERVKKDLNIVKEGGQGKYLGLPELFGRKKRDLFSSIVDRIKQRGLSWSSKLLSAAGKLVMLKSVLSAMPTYTMTCFKLPTNLCKRIQSALSRFWWDSKPEKKKMAWISWKKLSKSIREGGLGFRDIQNFNDALLAKVSWRILTKPDCLLSRVLRGKYCHKTSFLNSSSPMSASHGWKGICIGRDLLKTNLGRAVGNGESTSLWNDPWLSLDSPRCPLGPATFDAQQIKVSSLISPITKDWDINQIRASIPAYEEDILKLKPSKRGAGDKWLWLPVTSGDYSAKSGYYSAITEDEDMREHDASLLDVQWKKDIWNLKSSPKSKILLWKALRNVLPVGENLKSRHINPLANCPFCGKEETVAHLFFSCEVASQVWQLLPLQGQILTISVHNFRQGFECVKRLACLPPSGIGGGPLFPWVISAIWTARNHKIFKDKSTLPADIALQSIIRAKEWQSAQGGKAKPILPQHHSPRSLISPDVITCNSDAAWRDSSAAGIGWCFSDRFGSLGISSSSVVRLVSSPAMAEALAILAAMHHAIDLGFTKLSIASDSTTVIKAIKLESPTKELYRILHDILDLSSQFQCLSFIFIPRNSNRSADALAKAALRDFVMVPV
ncbi:Reverse transcriptase zinc-binding domain [Arabidopsis thaliana x Arabidopsis arenosa]|uniref:Reverse transcriptase zinc-binding domain n=1 Tax=Arabidopsis thaliana x Arabidopsis arenosa TaxID=1240361 RepID=A0A8T2C7C2_9BRAS|nr:Reverse transcriptase zinc-binding domain [Arabidopsis thaliana x Arabidopsis arenosa]